MKGVRGRGRIPSVSVGKGLIFSGSDLLKSAGGSYEDTDHLHGPFPIGVAQTGIKRVFVAVFAILAFDLNGASGGVTIGGVAMTPCPAGTSYYNGQRQAQLYYLDVAGSTTSVSPNLHNNGGGLAQTMVACYYDLATTFTNTSNNNQTRQLVAQNGTLSVTLTIPAGGYAIYILGDESDPCIETFSGTIFTDDAVLYYRGAHRAFFKSYRVAGTVTVTATATNQPGIFTPVLSAFG
jgi:hypothetical protein